MSNARASAEDPLVTVVMATYDGETWLAEAIDSILAQTWHRLELIVCDDGSHDRTVEILRAYGDRLLLIEGEHHGVADARNTAAAAGSGKYIAFLDQDDAWEPEMLATQVRLLEQHPRWGMVYADSLVVDRDGLVHGRRGRFLRYRSGHVFSDLIEGNFMPLETTVVRASLFNQSGGFRSHLGYLEDYDLFIRLAREMGVGFHPEPLARYRIHDRNLSHDLEALLAEWVEILDDLERVVGPLSGDERATRDQERSLRCADLAWRALRRLDLEASDHWFAEAGSGAPWRLAVRVRVLRALLGVLPRLLQRWAVALLPRRRLYGVENRLDNPPPASNEPQTAAR